MAYVTVGGKKQGSNKGQFLSAAEVFGEIGDVFEGIFRRAEEGQYGLDATFETDKGLACLTIKKTLRPEWDEADPQDGDCIRLELVDIIPSKTKGFKPFKKLQLDIDRDWSGPPPVTGDNVDVPAYVPKARKG